MIETVSAVADPLTGFGKQCDRQAAHFYRALHQRAVERERQWQQKAQAAQGLVEQLLVLVGSLLQQIKKLTGQLAWLRKQVFGSKSEIQKKSSQDAEGGPVSATLSDLSCAEGAARIKRRRGQQAGAKGPQRKVPLDLPMEVIDHRLEEGQRTCARCGKVRPESGWTEESVEVGWEVRLVCRKHVRHRYGPACDCAQGRGILTAPKPAKLMAKGLFAVDFWVEVLLKKFEFQQPLQRTLRELEAHGLAVSAGTLCGGLQKMKELLQPLAGQFVGRAREASHWHMDETRWPMFCLGNGPGRHLHWFWVVVTEQVTVFLLEETRSGQVPEAFFPKGIEGILNVDRYGGYFGLLGADWRMQLAYCWTHQRRDFVNVAAGADLTVGWTGQWIGLINELFALNARRRQAWFADRKECFAGLDQAVRQQVGRLQERLDWELAGGGLPAERAKILGSMRRHWKGLCVFVDHPEVPMDNSAAERALRPLAVGRKNFYGSGAQWSGELAGAAFTLLATLRQHHLCPRKFLQAYLEACAQNGGRAPERLAEFLPWTWSAEKRAAWQGKERPP